MSAIDPVNSLNRYRSYREGLTRDIRVHDQDGYAPRHGHVGRIGSGKSYQGKRALVLNTAQTEEYGTRHYRRNAMISNPKDRLRISKKKLTRGNGEGLTRREYVRRILSLQRDDGDGSLHRDTVKAGELFNNARLKSSSSRYNVNLRPLLSYKEVNNEDKRCKYGRFRDGGRWRCAQNLDHKRGGGDEVGDRNDNDGRDGRRMTNAQHEEAYPHLYHQDDDDNDDGKEDSMVPGRRPIRRASDKDASEEEEDDASDEEDDNEALKEARRKANRARERLERNKNRGSDEEFEDPSDEDNGGGGGDFGDAAYEEKEDNGGNVVRPDSDTEDDEVYARRIQRAQKEKKRKKQAAALKQIADYNKGPSRKSSRNK